MFITFTLTPPSLIALAVVLLFFVPPTLSWWRGKVRAGFERVRAWLRARAVRLQARVRAWLLNGQPGSFGEDVREGRDRG
ncbi:hypothetical protein ACE1N8_00085 [Streptomyces sp. DSM 116494]|uniref:hypothetical protein n=1 Tax=Streptomyces okerensis TaxID=3344655 RepID=UPI0038901686